MKKNVISWALLAGCVLALGTSVSACSGDDDDDDDGGGQPVVSQGDGGAAVFTGCAASGTGANITLKIRVGQQGLDPGAAPGDLPALSDTTVSLFDPVTGTTSNTAALTDAAGETIVTVAANSRYTLKMSHAADGTSLGSQGYADTYDYARLAPATTNTSGAPAVETRVIPVSVQSGIAAVIGVPTANLPGTMQFAGSVEDCTGEAIVGATLYLNGSEPNRCSGSATLPCVTYTTSTEENYSDDSGTVFLLGLPGTGTHTITVMAVLAEGEAPTQVGSLTVRGAANAIAVGGIPAQNVP